MYGVFLILVLMVTGGVIAWFGDTVGRKVGRRRLTLFGLRPRHTSIVITVVTGILIAGSSLAIMAIVSADVRTALFSMKQLQATLAQNQVQLRVKDAELAEKERRARRLEAEIAARTAEYDALNKQFQTVLSQRSAVDEALKKVKGQLDQIQGQYSKVINDYGFEKARVDRLKELAAPLAKAVDDLTRQVESLTKEKGKLESEISSLRTDLFFGNVAYRADEIVLSTVIRGGRPVEDVKKDLLAFLNGPANEAARKRGAKIEGKQTALQVVPEHFNQAAELIAGTNDRVVVRVISYTNTLVGNPVPVYFQLFRNQRIFRKGEVIASRRIDTSLSPDQMLLEILALLQDVNERAIRQGMVTTPEGTVGRTTNWTEIPDTINRIRMEAGAVTVQAVAQADTWSADGPLQIRLELNPEKSGLQPPGKTP
ncbi:MAG TPA: DUF3084 domain-containing protein [Firmicutes bacterium]|nr:DUF3084 domain-containing protein [Bacillota bacterium]